MENYKGKLKAMLDATVKGGTSYEKKKIFNGELSDDLSTIEYTFKLTTIQKFFPIIEDFFDSLMMDMHEIIDEEKKQL